MIKYVIQINNNNKCLCVYKNPKELHMCKNIIFGVLLHAVEKMVTF